jgi:hypothetical protein
MKISICDICYYQENQIVEAKYKAGFKHNVKVDLCEKHQNWHKQFKTPQEFTKGLLELMSQNEEEKQLCACGNYKMDESDFCHDCI